MIESPGAAGFRLPGEFEPHEATWMAWPHDQRTWIDGLEAAEEAFLAMIEPLSHGERVDLLVRPEDRDRASDRLATRTLGDVRLHEKEHADAWVRDTGPSVLVRGEERLAVDWRFDAWGGKYEAHKRDDDIASFIAECIGIDRVRIEQECEPGAYDANGHGVLLTTEDCLLKARGHSSRASVEELFDRVLGTEHVVWLRGGLQGDDTDGHVDTVARFLGPRTLALATPADGQDPDRQVLATNQARVGKLGTGSGDGTDEEASTPGGWDPGAGEQGPDGARIDIVELPQPSPVSVDGERRPASYANLYIGNDVVLLPVFGDDHDDIAHQRLAEVFEDRRIVEVQARPLIAGYGACHCLTQPIPTAEPA